MQTGNQAPPPVGYRRQFGLNVDWDFRRGDVSRSWLRACPPAGEQRVDLPHCWNEKDTFQVGIRYYQGSGAYRRTFDLPPPARNSFPSFWRLRSEGFYGTGDLWVNGKRLQKLDGQYLGFRADLSGHVAADGDNLLGIRLNNRYHPYVLPGKKMPDFLLFGGLSGRLYLEELPALHLGDDLLVRTALLSEKRARLDIRVTLVNRDATPRQARPRVSIRNAAGTEVDSWNGTMMQVPARHGLPIAATLTVDQPRRWCLRDRHLYIVSVLLEDGGVIDSQSRRIGLRDAHFDGDLGFFLNGERLFLQGANRHESIPGFGHALPDFLHREDAAIFKNMGLNFVRLSHYPEHPAFLDACDELGLLVFPEIASWKSVRRGPWLRAASRQMRDMIMRDRHHPSVILWGMGNESRSRKAFEVMNRIVAELDPARPTIYAENHLHRGVRGRTLALPDVLGVNYEFDVLDQAHQLSKTGALVISECSNRPHTHRGDMAAELEQVAQFEKDLARLGGKPYVAGYALWCFNDYATQRKQRFQRHPGVVDAWRLPKMAASYIAARTRVEPVVFIHGDWGRLSPDGDREVHIFSNAEQVVLSTGERVIAAWKGETHIVHRMAFIDAPLRVRATLAGQTAETGLLPQGKARAIACARETSGKSTAALRETVAFRCSVRDDGGEIVQGWNAPVGILVEGPARYRGHTPRLDVPMARGIGRFFLTGTGREGLVTIRLHHADLDGTACTVVYRESETGSPVELGPSDTTVNRTR